MSCQRHLTLDFLFLYIERFERLVYCMEIYIESFAERQKEIHRYLVSRSDIVIEYLIRIFLYPNRQELSSWKQEVAAALNRIYKLKDTHTYPTKFWILLHSWNVIEDTIKDSIPVIIEDYGESEHTEFNIIYNKIYTYFEWLAEELSKNGRVSNTKIYIKIEKLIEET